MNINFAEFIRKYINSKNEYDTDDSENKKVSIGGIDDMTSIKWALAHQNYDYDVENMTFKEGKFKGVKFFDRNPKRGDFCIDITEDTIRFCIESGINCFFVGFESYDGFRDIANRYMIPIEATEEIVTDFFEKYRFVGDVFRYVKRAITSVSPEYGNLVKSVKCSCCGNEITGENYNVDGNYICEHCFRSMYRHCDKCGNFYLLDKTKPFETLCPTCAKREYVLPYHRYSPPIDFCGSNLNNTVPYLGVELEVDDGGENDKTVKQLMKLINPKDKIFMYCMHDGSLSDGFEIITQPATLKYHTSIKGMYEQVFNLLLKKGYLSHDTTTCGIHVHFNRDFYADNEELYITRLLYLVDKFWDEIVRFSRRNQRRLDRYSKKVDISIKDYYRRSNKSGNHDFHYYAVNLANENTIEFRMFKGSLNIDTFMATLQFVHNCIMCAKEKNAEEIQSMKFEELITGRCCKAYWKNRKDRFNTEE